MPSARLGLRVSRIPLPLARFLETGGAKRMVHLVESLARTGSGSDDATDVHHFVIVARDRAALYRHFAESLAGNKTITVLLDRRRSD